MKYISLSLLCILSIHAAFTQALDTTQFTRISHYLFPDFIKGTVKQKNGNKEEAIMNYNSITQEMIFLQNGAYLALGQLENIDTVFIEGRKFIPVKEVFYEILTDTPVPLLINHKCRVIPPGKNAGYGSTSQTSSIDNISRIVGSSITYPLKLPNDYTIIPESEFLLKKDNDYIRILNAKQVSKAFPAKSNAIQEYIKMNKTSFRSKEDLTKLIMFCNQS